MSLFQTVNTPSGVQTKVAQPAPAPAPAPVVQTQEQIAAAAKRVLNKQQQTNMLALQKKVAAENVKSNFGYPRKITVEHIKGTTKYSVVPAPTKPS